MSSELCDYGTQQYNAVAGNAGSYCRKGVIPPSNTGNIKLSGDLSLLPHLSIIDIMSSVKKIVIGFGSLRIDL